MVVIFEVGILLGKSERSKLNEEIYNTNIKRCDKAALIPIQQGINKGNSSTSVFEIYKLIKKTIRRKHTNYKGKTKKYQKH